MRTISYNLSRHEGTKNTLGTTLQQRSYLSEMIFIFSWGVRSSGYLAEIMGYELLFSFWREDSYTSNVFDVEGVGKIGEGGGCFEIPSEREGRGICLVCLYTAYIPHLLSG